MIEMGTFAVAAAVTRGSLILVCDPFSSRCGAFPLRRIGVQKRLKRSLAGSGSGTDEVVQTASDDLSGFPTDLQALLGSSRRNAMARA